MRFLLLAALAWPLTVLGAPAASGKPQQIRSDQDPTFHLYLQSYPKNCVSFPLLWAIESPFCSPG